MQNESEREEIQTVKVIVVGETGVGKSSLIRKICSGMFDAQTVRILTLYT
jgi:GTPase SAR1 family protein